MGKNTTPERTEPNRPGTSQTPTQASSGATTAQPPPHQPPPPQPAHNYEPPAQTPNERSQATTARAISETESLARDIKEGIVSGFVGNGTLLKGDATFKGMLRVDGHLSGRISSEKGTLIVSNGGQVDANVAVGIARINGVVNGDIIATERIELGRTARVNGNIQTPALVIEQGAVFDGSCRMNQSAAAPETDREDKYQTTRPSTSKSPSSLAKGAVEKYEAANNSKAQATAE
jgi:cytoskeletal protein CcmA (bactofilin family)